MLTFFFFFLFGRAYSPSPTNAYWVKELGWWRVEFIGSKEKPILSDSIENFFSKNFVVGGPLPLLNAVRALERVPVESGESRIDASEDFLEPVQPLAPI